MIKNNSNTGAMIENMVACDEKDDTVAKLEKKFKRDLNNIPCTYP